jgi:hypothetical protein
MVCQACGAPVAQDVRFCSKCGAQMPAQPPAPPVYPTLPYVSRVRRHLQTMGILWCAYGVYRIVRGLVAMTMLRAFTLHAFGGGWPFWAYYHGPSPAPWMHTLLPVIATISVVWAALALLVGYSLLTRRPWGRVLAIIMAILSLIRIPFGTALGIYTLWVLASGVSGMEYEQIADPT